MSDGPHRSLPMRLGWKRVAECGDNRAFVSEEVSEAIVPALEQDCHAEMAEPFALFVAVNLHCSKFQLAKSCKRSGRALGQASAE
jgi:hypothetical protein